MSDLDMLGWNSLRGTEFEPLAREGLVPARVAVGRRGAYVLLAQAGELRGELTGRFRHDGDPQGRPTVGDWVGVRPRPEAGEVLIERVLARRSAISRKTAGLATEEQVVAANIDVLFLVSGLDHDFNPRRLERAALLAWESGARPVVLLTKSDLCTEAEARLRDVESLVPGAPAHLVSAPTGRGLEAVEGYLGRGVTAALMGSSGVGKSTLVNRLLGEDRMATGPVRAADSRGRHVTTHRELILLPGGRGILIDTPGLRELQLWGTEEGLAATFSDVEAAARDCRFRDCAHRSEPGCAVRAAVADGHLAPERLDSYERLRKELRHLAARQDGLARQEEARRTRIIHRAARRLRPRG